jgi:hypothetical protein
VVDVRMRQQHAVQCFRIKGEACAIFRFGLAAALEHAAIDEHFDVVGLKQEARSGNFACGAEKGQFQGVASRASSVRVASKSISLSVNIYGGMK